MRYKIVYAILALVISATASAAPAIVVKIDDEICRMTTPTTVSLGTIHFVLNDSYQWVLSCHGDLVEGEYPRKALVYRASDDNPVIGPCGTPFGMTNNMHVVVTPSGKTKATCWGMVSY